MTGVVLFTAGLLVGGCNANRPAPVSDAGISSTGKSAATSRTPRFGRDYIVRRGDTLYSIAFTIRQDYRQLAHWNGIRSPYTIYVGQRLHLYPRSASKSQAPARSTSREPASRAPSAPAPSVTERPMPNAAVRSWRWPTRSQKVLSSYSPRNGREGIDIAGRRGDAIYAAAAGRVVYAGSGLRGYGRLIIIKHNNTYLSAYAHNDRLLVSEGQDVGSGQKIAEMGNSGTDRFKLHFEIRKDGTPVDPLKYLRSG